MDSAPGKAGRCPATASRRISSAVCVAGEGGDGGGRQALGRPAGRGVASGELPRLRRAREATLRAPPAGVCEIFAANVFFRGGPGTAAERPVSPCGVFWNPYWALHHRHHGRGATSCGNTRRFLPSPTELTKDAR